MNYITEFKQIAVELIEPSHHHSENDYSPDEISSVAQDIKEKGLMQPLLVGKTKENKYQIILGIKRYLAFKKLGYSTVGAGIVNEMISVSEAWALALRYPSLSELLSDTDKSNAIKFLIDNKKITLNQISDQTGINIDELNRYLTVFEFDKELKEMLEKGKISLKISVISHKLKQTLSKLTETELDSSTSCKIGEKLLSEKDTYIEDLEKIIRVIDKN